MPDAAPLVGRDSELEDVVTLLDGAAESASGGLLLSGDAGVGKTRLLNEVLARADERGMIRLVGHCMDFGDIGLPFLPFSEAFGRLAKDAPELIEELERDFAPIARLLPKHRLIGAAPAPDETRLERADLFASVLAALGRIGQHRPTLVVIEDTHWADQSTRDLIGFLLTRLDHERVALVVSYRSDDLHRKHPLRAAIAEWSRLPGVRRVDLRPLPDNDIRTLIGFLHPSPMSESEIRQIVSRADGNAFFTEELVTASVQGGREGSGREMTVRGVPAALADLLLVRLDRLSDPTRGVVRLVAVAGRRVPHTMLERVAWLSDTELDVALREAVDAHILQPVGESQYAFRHALLGEAVYDDLLPGERVRLHGEFASALAKESVRGTAAELARHARESHDLDTAFEASVRAGDEAIAVAAPQEAVRHYEAALGLLGRVSATVDCDPVSLVIKASDAAAASGYMLRAVDFAKAGLSGMPADVNPQDRARVLYALADHASEVEGELDALEATTEALNLVPADPPSSLRARLSAMHARTLIQLGRDDEASRWANEAADMADRVDDLRAASDARTTIAVLVRRQGDPDEAHRQLEELAAHAHVSGHIADELRALFQIGVLSFSRGSLEAAASAFQRCWDRAREVGREWATYGIDARCNLILLNHYRGDWDAAARTADLSEEQPPRFAALKVTSAGMAVRAGRGEVAAIDVLPHLREKWRQDGLMAVWSLPQVAELHSQQGRTDEAIATIDELTQVITAVWQQPWFLARLRVSAMGLGILSAGIPAMTAAQRATAVTRGERFHRDGHATMSYTKGKVGPEAIAWRDRLDAEWARLRWLADAEPPSVDEQIDLWSVAIESFADQPYERATSQTRLAAVLKAAGRTADAAPLIAAAVDVATRLGAAPLVADLRALGGARQTASSGGAEALTSRERDVLQLLVEGRTNRQIARQLYISEKTVSVHVSNILAKLGVGSRTEAAARARREGILSGSG